MYFVSIDLLVHKPMINFQAKLTTYKWTWRKKRQWSTPSKINRKSSTRPWTKSANELTAWKRTRTPTRRSVEIWRAKFCPCRRSWRITTRSCWIASVSANRLLFLGWTYGIRLFLYHNVKSSLRFWFVKHDRISKLGFYLFILIALLFGHIFMLHWSFVLHTKYKTSWHWSYRALELELFFPAPKLLINHSAKTVHLSGKLSLPSQSRLKLPVRWTRYHGCYKTSQEV